MRRTAEGTTAGGMTAGRTTPGGTTASGGTAADAYGPAPDRAVRREEQP
ncbi:hypothetical protein ABZ901_23640 [Actinacidiphila alni]